MTDLLELETTMTTAKAHVVLARIEQLRKVRQAYERGVHQTDLAEANKVSQPAISQWLKMARIDAPDIRPGTAGGTPYEIAARCAAGLLSREAMIKQLSSWVYSRAEMSPDGEGDVPPLNLSGFNLQVGRALDDRFIDDAEYDRILEAVAD
ncbi:hypothetical protein AYK61_25975 [Rhodococcus sp. SBT000017]|jgi:predicted transcriptional regulator|uniref:hypothetical protein n=1 Tax=Rhodococcus sp. SBT000017 TaxID=1803385 RepID=UPI000EF8EFDD|nr:hypothetical protein [Rhodococcus sp. SBT000017]RMB70186.1 hypothetical protein AYK61_25975 [Rhodococcus sp. SBT000017]